MARVSVVPRDKARRIAAGTVEYFGGDAPIHLHLHELAAGADLAFAVQPIERLAYVLDGAVEVGGTELAHGAVIVIERGVGTTVRGRADRSLLLLFGGAAPSAQPRAGGHVHLLPRDRAPTVADLGASGVGGTIFADARCPTCTVWLHENRFPATGAPPTDPQAGIHAHDEDEIIFVTGGGMKLGQRLVGPGTAIAIAANTLYGFTPSPKGLSFINFRAALPGIIRFADGRTADEVAVWGRVDRPLEYLSPQGGTD